MIEARKAGKKDPVLLLTKVDGGVFRNDDAWIVAAMTRAIQKAKKYGIGMDIRVVHFGNVNNLYCSLES